MQKITFHAIEKLDFRTKESYKSLRTNLEFSGKNCKAISITSCTPNEGKSSVSFQLALSIAETGKKVMLVDADLRKSILRSRYRANAARYGLSHYLSGQASIEDIACETNIPGFHVIFTGPVPPNPSELLGNEYFALLMEYLREEYDFIIVDTPPLGSVIDGAVVAKRCDGTVIIIESGAISYKFAQNIRDQLRQIDCRILGVVLNKVKMSSRGYYGNYYGKYYGKYYGNYYGHEDEGGLHKAVIGNKKKPKVAKTEKAETLQPADETKNDGIEEISNIMQEEVLTDISDEITVENVTAENQDVISPAASEEIQDTEDTRTEEEQKC